jgi:hypothetical protein
MTSAGALTALLVTTAATGSPCLNQRQSPITNKVKSLSPDHRFVIALHSPNGVVKTGLPECPPEKNTTEPSVTDPPAAAKVEILHLMENLGIETVDVGLPGAGARQREAVLALCREISDRRMRIRPNCAARTMMVDILPIAEASQLTGVPIEACLFIGSSPIRQYAEEWTLEQILRHTREAIRFAVKEGLDRPRGRHHQSPEEG